MQMYHKGRPSYTTYYFDFLSGHIYSKAVNYTLQYPDVMALISNGNILNQNITVKYKIDIMLNGSTN